MKAAAASSAKGSLLRPLSWFLDADPIDIRASRIDAASASIVEADNMTTLLRYPDGSLATVIYCAIGNPGTGKERIELFGGGRTVIIDDFKSISFAGIDRKNQSQATENKGQYELLQNWIRAIRGETELSVTVRHGLRATRIAREAMRQCSPGGGF
jgi:predicted dehydrogenase